MNQLSSWSSDQTSKPTVYIDQETKDRLDLYIQTAEGEISGLGTVGVVGNDLFIEEVFLFEQECSSGSTDLSQEAVANLLFQAVKNGQDPSNLKFWWHSHSYGTSWSPTDNNTIDGFKNQWMVSLVQDKRGEVRLRLDFFEPIRLTLDQLPLRVQRHLDPALRSEVEQEVAAKVRVKPAPEAVVICGAHSSWFSQIGAEMRQGLETEPGNLEEVGG